MRYLWLLIILAACPDARASKPAAPVNVEVHVVPGDETLATTLQGTLDTAKVSSHWECVQCRATSYLLTATAVTWGGGVWNGLPVNLSVPGVQVSPSMPGLVNIFKATNATADSAEFVVCVRSVNAVGESNPKCSAPKRWRRPPSPPSNVVIDTITLSLFPPRLDIPGNEVQAFCLAWRFPNGHVAMRTTEKLRSINGYGQTCGDWYREHRCRLEAAEWKDCSTLTPITLAEQTEVDRRVGERWSSDDTMVAKVHFTTGMVISHPRYATLWQQWKATRQQNALEATWVHVFWRDQKATGIAAVTSTGWFVAPTGTETGDHTSRGDGSPLNPWSLSMALNMPQTIVKPGDTIYLRGGTYRGAFRSTISGTSGKSIVVRPW